MNIPFNKTTITGIEKTYVSDALADGRLSGNRAFSKKCQSFFSSQYGFKKVLLTNSCTDALEMSALLLQIKPGDEVILPAYTFVSTANAFLLRGAELKFADSQPGHPNISTKEIERLINTKTKAIVVVHYGGVACQMDEILEIAKQFGVPVIEDAAQAIDGFYKEKALGSMGTFGTFSFHETKNITSGEGGMITVNEEQFFEQAEIVLEKGTNRMAFHRGEVNKYNWVSPGSSYLPSELNAALLFGQINRLNEIQQKRVNIWQAYYNELKALEDKGCFQLPQIADYATNNGHLFYLLFNSKHERDAMLNYLNDKGILAVFHYLALHQSPYFKHKYEGPELVNADKFTNQLMRLPLFYDLKENELQYIIEAIWEFCSK
jgi:dTDP-4-amino-4,6-dideoxygalactose transaminase